MTGAAKSTTTRDDNTAARPAAGSGSSAGGAAHDVRRELRGMDFAAGAERLAVKGDAPRYTGVVIDPGVFAVRMGMPFDAHRDMATGSIDAGDPTRVPGAGIVVDAEKACHLRQPKVFTERAKAMAHAGANPYVIDEARLHDIVYRPGYLQLMMRKGVREELAAIEERDKVSGKVALVVSDA